MNRRCTLVLVTSVSVSSTDEMNIDGFLSDRQSKGGSRFFRKGGGPLTERGGPNNLGGSGGMPPGKILELLIANGAFLINLDHQLRAEISPIFSQYFFIKCPPAMPSHHKY